MLFYSSPDRSDYVHSLCKTLLGMFSIFLSYFDVLLKYSFCTTTEDALDSFQ